LNIQDEEPVQEPQPEESVQPETQPEEPQPAQNDSFLDPAVRYAEEVKQLLDMGFFDAKKNLELLERNQGDIFRVIAQLLD